jgi:hypothetical protein
MVCGKEKIRLLLFVFVLTFLVNPSYGQEEIIKKFVNQEVYAKKVNFGIKAGFRSSNYVGTDLSISGNEVEDLQNKYHLGYYGAFYTRINFKRRFLQTEVSYNIDRAGMSFNKSQSTSSNSVASVSSSIYSFGLPILYGYDVVRQGPYTMAVFIGPKLEYVYKSNVDFINFDQQNIQEVLNRLNGAIVAGISVNISKVFFDFRYEQEVRNISKSITCTQQTSTGGTEAGNIEFHRRQSCLSFSIGIFF